MARLEILLLMTFVLACGMGIGAQLASASPSYVAHVTVVRGEIPAGVLVVYCALSAVFALVRVSHILRGLEKGCARKR